MIVLMIVRILRASTGYLQSRLLKTSDECDLETLKKQRKTLAKLPKNLKIFQPANAGWENPGNKKPWEFFPRPQKPWGFFPRVPRVTLGKMTHCLIQGNKPILYSENL